MEPTDRVLVTSLEERGFLRAWAEEVREGALVGLGSDEQVRAARREMAEFDHVMFIVGSRDEVPWQEAWFSVIVDVAAGEPTAEMLRVLAPGGRIEGPQD